MIPGAAYMGINAVRRKRSLLSVIQGLGLTTNLKLCLDAGDSASYDGSSQTWVDRSGTATNFYRGTSSGSDTTDPTFNGVAGGLSANEYFSFDGGDYFTLVSGANPSWVQPFHKDAATFTAMFAFYAASGFNHYLMGDVGASGGAGFTIASGAGLGLVVWNASGSVLSATAAASTSVGSWNILGVSVNENGGASGGVFSVNGTTETFNAAYSSPSSASAASTLKIATDGGGFLNLVNGERVGWTAVWDTNLSAAQMQSIYIATRGRFGI